MNPLGQRIFSEKSNLQCTRSVTIHNTTKDIGLPVPGYPALSTNIMARIWNTVPGLQHASTLGAAKSLAKKWAKDISRWTSILIYSNLFQYLIILMLYWHFQTIICKKARPPAFPMGILVSFKTRRVDTSHCDEIYRLCTKFNSYNIDHIWRYLFHAEHWLSC